MSSSDFREADRLLRRQSLLFATREGNVDAVRTLLEADASLVGAKDSDNSTPLHCAAWKGHPEVAALLDSHVMNFVAMK